MIQAIKNMMGYVEIKSDDKKHQPTHIILTAKEYEEMQQQISNLGIKLEKEQKEFKSNISRIKSDCKKEIDTAYNDAQNKITVAEEKVRQAKEEKEYQARLNANLLRINKERSNADRKLQPKSKHTGYCVIQSQERTISQNKHKSIIWETTIQSPYPVDLSEEIAKQQISTDMHPDDNNWLLAQIGITTITLHNEDASKYLKDEYINKNVIYTQHFRANYKSGYWEVIYQHTKALDIVPKDMR